MFKIGQKVVCVDDKSRTGRRVYVEAGNIYTITGFCACLKCGIAKVYLKENKERYENYCMCGNIKTDVARFDVNRFRPLISKSECISYKLTVSLPELTELKELQNC